MTYIVLNIKNIYVDGQIKDKDLLIKNNFNENRVIFYFGNNIPISKNQLIYYKSDINYLNEGSLQIPILINECNYQYICKKDTIFLPIDNDIKLINIIDSLNLKIKEKIKKYRYYYK